MGRCNQRLNGLYQGTTGLYQGIKGKMGLKPQENPKCTTQSPEYQGKLDICGEIQWEAQSKACG